MKLDHEKDLITKLSLVIKGVIRKFTKYNNALLGDLK